MHSRLTILIACNVNIIAYDVTERKVTKLVNQHLKPRTYEIQYDGTNYPSGVYYYQLTINDYKLMNGYRETKSMALVK